MSTGDTRAAFLKLRITLSKEDVKAAQRSVSGLREGYLDLEDAEIAAAQAAELYLKSANKEIQVNAKVADSAKKATKEIRNLGAERAEAARLATQSELKTARTENRAESFAIRGALGAIPGGGGQIGQTASEVFQLIDAIPELGLSFKILKSTIIDNINSLSSALGTTTPRLVGLGLALGALAVGLSLLQKQAEASKQAAATAIEGALSYFTIINTKNREQVDEALAAANVELKVRQERFKAVSDLLFQTREEIKQFGTVSEASIKLGAFLGIAAGELTATSEAFDKEHESLDAAQASVLALESAQRSDEVAARSLAEAEAELTAKRQTAFDAIVNQQIQVLLRAQTMTGEQAKERLKAIDDETHAIKAFIDTAGLSKEAQDELERRLTLLQYEKSNLQALAATTIAHNDELAYQKKQLEETTEAVKKYNENVKNIEQQALDARAQANKKYADAVIAIAQKAADAAADALKKLQEKRASLALDLARDEEDSELDRQRKEIDARIEFARDEEKATREHVKNLKRIRREGQRDEDQAVQDRDAVALDAAQTRTKDALNDEIERNDEERKEREIAYRDQLNDQRIQFNRERQDRLTKYQRDLSDAQAQYQRELQLAEQKRVQELALAQKAKADELLAIQQKYMAQLATAKAGIVNELALISKGWQERLKIDAAYQQALLNQAKAIQGGAVAYNSGNANLSSGGGFKGGKPILTPPQLATGGYIQREGLAYLHAGETVVPANGRGRGGSTYNINLNGATVKTMTAISLEQAVAAVHVALEELGAT